jgi:hypothetical protein
MNPRYHGIHNINDEADKNRRSGFARRQTAPKPFSGTERRKVIDRRYNSGKRYKTPNDKPGRDGKAFITRAIRFLVGKNERNGNNVKNIMGSGQIHEATHLIDRAHDRIPVEAPISIQDGDTYDIFPGMLFNHSQAGMYVETETAPRVHSGVVIHMQNYAPHAAAPENIRKYYGQVRWCQKLSGMVVFVNYGVGIKLCSDLDEFIKTFGL